MLRRQLAHRLLPFCVLALSACSGSNTTGTGPGTGLLSTVGALDSGMYERGIAERRQRLSALKQEQAAKQAQLRQLQQKKAQEQRELARLQAETAKLTARQQRAVEQARAISAQRLAVKREIVAMQQSMRALDQQLLSARARHAQPAEMADLTRQRDALRSRLAALIQKSL